MLACSSRRNYSSVDLPIPVPCRAHYPGTITVPEALFLKKQLWSSEDYSTFNDDVGGGCWARILNRNYVNGRMSAYACFLIP